MGRPIELDRDTQKSNRPYYIIPDNFKSNFRVQRIDNFSSINEIQTSRAIRKTSTEEDYFETSYLVQIRKKAVRLKK